MIPEPTRQDIDRWQRRLDEDRDYQRILLQFQRSVYELFEGFRRETGSRPIRAIIYRDEIKSVESLVEKIVRKRRTQNTENQGSPGKHTTPYDLDQVKDLIGIKVLCPFRADSDRVAKFLFHQKDRVQPIEANPAAGRRDEKRGYRGYNFTVFPAMGRRFDLTGLFCEVQIKTMLEESWDAMTHDLTYKREAAIPDELQRAFSILGDNLEAVEGTAGIFREQVEKLFAAVTRHREDAALIFFSGVHTALNELRRQHSLTAVVPEITESTPLNEETFSVDAIAAVNEALRAEMRKGLTASICKMALFLALCSRVPGQANFALRLANDLVALLPESGKTEMVRASVLWALGRFDACVVAAEGALAKVPEPDPRERMGDFCYYVSDARVFHTFVPGKTETKVLELAEQLAREEAPGFMDTAGFALIVFGDDDRAVHRGIDLVSRAKATARGGDPALGRLAEVFCDRHLHLADLRLKKEAWWS